MNQTKTAIITGASQGIGKNCALGLARMGYHCILMARNQEKLEEVAEIIKQNGGESSLFAIDLTQEEELVSCLQTIKKYYGNIQVLVNNAGMYTGGTLQITSHAFRQQLELNLTAGFILLQELVPVMKAQKSGSIFNIVSRSGKVGFAQSGAYSASKFGLLGLSESLYRELAEYGIAVTAICPAWVATEMASVAGSPHQNDEMIQPEDIFKTIAYLLSLAPNTRIKEIVIEARKSIR
ncbi:SDR family oxidoreductase [Sunxiuqinia elliptica]|uniref:3-oxoacyl-[acyl-carrier protein] reductase n=1 Tax=Sunxiuqinia elliptica TaxID=655355 RepID=A0A4R6H4F1_9BACT|nr:SDR family oxidoreductase [Sunxiuqinia elliptica]TDO02608.1 3-oxoacyl-[acyl-carrier protein] reductase [Sunxiuqinia elliptica]TDO58654.1 3-oxoacyl-[acyl-carrier protein] reductase [Sunxiuqinia elliptica]